MRSLLFIMSLLSVSVHADEDLVSKLMATTGLREGNYALVRGYDRKTNTDDCLEGPLKIFSVHDKGDSVSVKLAADPIALGIWRNAPPEKDDSIVTTYNSEVKAGSIQAKRKQVGSNFTRRDDYAILVKANGLTYTHRVYVNNDLKHDWTCELVRD